MSFELMWPLAFVISVPVILILYLLRPKGVPKTVPSNLIWRKLLGSNSMSSFKQKFLSDPLMYLEMLIALLLVAALMGPIKNGVISQRGDTVIVIDTSAGMQHKADGDKTRFDLAREYAEKEAGLSGKVTLIGCDIRANLLFSGQGSDKRLRQIIRQMQPSDLAGDLNASMDLIESLSTDSILILTDGNGQRQLGQLPDHANVVTFGDPAGNLALSYVAVEEDQAVAMVSSFSDLDARCDVTLTDPNGKLLKNLRISVPAGGQENILFTDLGQINGAYVRAEISGITFLDENGQELEGAADSLEKDNENYGFTSAAAEVPAALVSAGGNRYLEKAYQAVSGKTLPRLANESLLSDEELIIYDFGTYIQDDATDQANADGEDPFASSAASGKENSSGKTKGILRFGGREEMAGELEHVEVSCTRSEITKGIEGASFGVNQTIWYEVPSWAQSFLQAGDKCVGYYGVDPFGNRRVVVGFDIRESNLPLLAEFPVLFAGSTKYLADQSLLKQQTYTAGQAISLRPSAGSSIKPEQLDTSVTGVYELDTEKGKEYYAVLFPMEAESDGRFVPEENTGNHIGKKVTSGKNVRNLLLAVILLLLGLDLFWYVKKKRIKRRSVYVLAGVLALLILAAIADLRLPVLGSSRATVFLVDLSDSNRENEEKMQQYLSDQLAKKPKKDYFGVIAFGKDAQIDQFLTRSDHFTPLSTMPISSASDLEGATAKAVTLFDEKTTGRIVLLTDGRETEGRLSRMETALAKSDIELCALFFDTSPRQDVYPSEVDIPSVLHAGDAYRMEVKIQSSYETDAVIELLSASRKIQEQKVHLLAGENRFVFGMEVSGQENETFNVTVRAEGDECPENDRYFVYAKVEDQQRLLVIVGKGADYGQLVRILDAANVEYDLVSVKNAPEGLEKLAPYRSVLLDDVYIGDLPSGFLNDIEAYVRDYGGGLIACGGENSFALGGYRESVLEQVLPVDMEPRGINETPAIAMLMVIDHSGSMTDPSEKGRSRLDLAIEAACRAVDNLSSKDYVGVITFDDSPTWQVPYVQVKDKEAIKDAIKKTKEGGGTMIGPAVKEAYDCLKDETTPIKHILLLTDGQGETNNFSSLTSAIKAEAITLSTVAVGEDADDALLRKMATDCGGRFYESDDKTDIPRIFAKEVLMSGDSYLQNGDFTLAMNRSDEILEGLFEEGAEQITGYVAATAKTGANQLITSDKDDPILTVWQYGMGKTVAWNSDVSGVWSGKLFSQDDSVAMWKRICEYSFGYQTETGDRLEYVEGDTEGSEKRIRYSTSKASGATTIEGVVTGPDKERKELVLSAKSPGVYEAQLPEGEEGVYYLSVLRKENGEIVSTVQSAAIKQFSDEYRFEISDKQVKDFVERIGRTLTPEQSVWKGENRLKSSSRSLTIPLLITALLLFLLQIAHRRLELGALWADRRQAKMQAKMQTKEPVKEPGGQASFETEQGAAHRDKPAGAVTMAKADHIAAPQTDFAGGLHAEHKAAPDSVKGKGSTVDPYSAMTDPKRTAAVTGEEKKPGQKDPYATGMQSRGKDGKKAAAKEKGAAQSAAGLDTSLLLKKKRDRDGG